MINHQRSTYHQFIYKQYHRHVPSVYFFLFSFCKFSICQWFKRHLKTHYLGPLGLNYVSMWQVILVLIAEAYCDYYAKEGAYLWQFSMNHKKLIVNEFIKMIPELNYVDVGKYLSGKMWCLNILLTLFKKLISLKILSLCMSKISWKWKKICKRMYWFNICFICW